VLIGLLLRGVSELFFARSTITSSPSPVYVRLVYRQSRKRAHKAELRAKQSS